MTDFPSWGAYPEQSQQGRFVKDRFSDFAAVGIDSNSAEHNQSLLPYGLGRSYGDSCQNLQGLVLSSKALNHFIHFDDTSGLLTVEAGVSLADIIEFALPKGWFLPVTPGTKFVTVAGAIANDVHGKNHHSAGSFANHIACFELLRSDGTRLLCSESDNNDWYQATIGGLGLTGFITWAVLQLKPVKSRFIDSESFKYQTLNEFFTLSEESEAEFEYTAAWLDCSAKGKKLGRGQFIRGNHAVVSDLHPLDQVLSSTKLAVPVTPPMSCINRLSVPAFNFLYFHRQKSGKTESLEHFDPFFYPLDGIHHWNRLYGKKGFVQYQCVVPKAVAEDAIKTLLEKISRSGQGSFLVVLKMMGDAASKGLLSFPMGGATLALDFPMLGDKTLRLLNDLDETVKQAGGRLYPAKDARMSAEFFQAAYPNWQQVEEKRDPKIMSDFWRRVTGIES
jgi:FAD/FMN-containing dehydrogenase